MSVYAQFSEVSAQHQFASNSGYGDFGRWVESLDADKFPSLVELWDTGATDHVTDCAKEIETALEENKPDTDTESVIDALLAALDANRNSEMLMITNGVL